jgi:pantetheine-phosphate adenylyltransferase
MKEQYRGFEAAIKTAQSGIYGRVISENVMKAYAEPHRHWHNQKHLQEVFTKVVESYNTRSLKGSALLHAAIYHDAVYDPYATDNEEKSVEFMLNDLKFNGTELAHKEVVDLATKYILETKDLTIDNEFNRIDRAICKSTNLLELMEYGEAIWKENDRYSWSDFVFGHLEIFKQLSGETLIAAQYEKWLRNKKPRLGIYAGSFNPFHIGHKAIADTAKTMFDKVLLAKGVNLDKRTCTDWDRDVSEQSPICGYQVVEFYGMLTKLVKEYSRDYDVTIVKGIRNSADLEYEKTQERYLRKILPSIKMIYIFSSAEHEHISSSAIRNLEKYGQSTSNYLP